MEFTDEEKALVKKRLAIRQERIDAKKAKDAEYDENIKAKKNARRNFVPEGVNFGHGKEKAGAAELAAWKYSTNYRIFSSEEDMDKWIIYNFYPKMKNFAIHRDSKIGNDFLSYIDSQDATEIARRFIEVTRHAMQDEVALIYYQDKNVQKTGHIYPDQLLSKRFMDKIMTYFVLSSRRIDKKYMSRRFAPQSDSVKITEMLDDLAENILGPQLAKYLK
jgi:hypothetical protein